MLSFFLAMAARWLIVGLGNPGRAYATSRHNVGFWCINRLARKHGIPLSTKRLYARGDGTIGGLPVILAKPRTFVNRSGHAVSALLRNERMDTPELFLVCDDLDLPLGKLRIRPSGSHGGHNGLRSIIAALGTSSFPRLRIGIGRPQAEGEPVWDPETVADFVLTRPSPPEREALDAAVGRALDALDMLVTEGLEAAMNMHNRDA